MDGWVRLNEIFSDSPSGEGWILVDGSLVGLGVQLQRKAFERPRHLKRLVSEGEVEIRDGVKNGVIVGHRISGRILRTDLELGGWMRLTEDFRRPGRDDGDQDICEGWFSLAANPVIRWQPPGGAEPEMLPSKPVWFWVASLKGTVVRERPWGSVITKREHGALLRGDLLQDGWLRLEEDFVRTSGCSGHLRGKGGDGEEEEVGMTVCSEDATELLRGWVLLDGRELGLPCQLQRRDRERSIPKPSIEQPGGGRVFISWELHEEVAHNWAEKFERRRLAAEIDHKEDWTIEAVARLAGIAEETADVLRRCGVDDIHSLLRVASRGDAQEELKNVGVSRLGARTKLTKLLTPYWDAQQAKERANESYRVGQHEEAIRAYSAILESISCHSTILALSIYNNRAAAYQQLSRLDEALADALHVLRYDVTNGKAMARKDKAIASGAHTPAEVAETEAAKADWLSKQPGATEIEASMVGDVLDEPVGGEAPEGGAAPTEQGATCTGTGAGPGAHACKPGDSREVWLQIEPLPKGPEQACSQGAGERVQLTIQPVLC